MHTLTEMVPEMFIKGCSVGRGRTLNTQEAQEVAATLCPDGGQCCGAWRELSSWSRHHLTVCCWKEAATAVMKVKQRRAGVRVATL